MSTTAAPPTLSISGANARAVADLADAVARLNDAGITVEVVLTGDTLDPHPGPEPAARVAPRVVHRASEAFRPDGPVVGVQADLFSLVDSATDPAPDDADNREDPTGRAPRSRRPVAAQRSTTVLERFEAHDRRLLPFADALALVPAEARKLLDSAGVGQRQVRFGTPTRAQGREMELVYHREGSLKAVREWLGSTGLAHTRLMLRAAGVRIRPKDLRARPDEITDEALRDLFESVDRSKKRVADTLHVDTYYAHELLFEAGVVDVEGHTVD